MYKLYWSPKTGAFAPQAVLEEVGAEYDRIVVDTDSGAHQRSDFLAINPRGQVPALVLPDGSVMTESAAMVLHIADRHQDVGLLPAIGDPVRAQVYRWLFFFVANLYEADLRYYYSDRYTTDPNCTPGIKETALRDFERYLEMTERAIGDGPYLLGERYTVADIYLVMVTYWHPMPAEVLDRCATLSTLCQRVQARPAIQRVWAQHYSA